MKKKSTTLGLGFWSKSMLLINLMIALATAIGYMSPYIDPKSIWIFSFFGLFYPLMLIANLVFIFYWLFKDMRYSLISLITILLGWTYLKSFFILNTSNVSHNPHLISVISYNIGNANEAYDKKKDVKEEKKIKMFDYLKRFNDEDIICLQEVGPYAYDILKKSFSTYQIYRTEKGAIIMTKHAIVNKGQIDFGTITNSCLWADVVVDLDTIRVYSVHLQSNQISKDANEVIDHGKMNDKKTWEGISGILKKYKYTHITRAEQAIKVRQHMDASPYPVLLCGDLNDTPVSYIYKKLSDGYQDAFIEKGNGMGSTFNGKIPFLRIDYIMATPDFEINKFNVIKENYSDHFAIASLLSLKK